MKPSSVRSVLSAQAIGALLIVISVCGVGAYFWLHPAAPAPETYVSLLFDASLTSGQNERCGDAGRIAQQVATAPGAVHLALFATGDHTTGGEPIRLGLVERPRSANLMEREVAGGNAAFVRTTTALCADVVPRIESPIIQAIGSVVASLPVELCRDPNNFCAVWVRTDGLEESDRPLMAALRGRHGRASSSPAAFIDNAFTDVIICGLSVRHIGRGTAALPSTDTIASAYRARFSTPSRVRFEPHCAAFTASPESSAPVSATDTRQAALERTREH